ncbi:hypothetical protein KGY79_13085 [Candidatus Bipolaricaulota bacterium]|nr:hypothetical protein [Candidatus Bipolaricaulota bacterium]
MQATIYYQEEDEYLMDKVEQKAERERRSRSAVILSIIESYFEAEKKIGEILRDLDAASTDQIEESLEEQQEDRNKEKLGRILLDKGYVREVDLDKALAIQDRTSEELKRQEL